MSSTSPASNGSHGKQFNNQVSVVLGAQWGDEGKGKIVDLLATKADIVCRVQVNKAVLLHFLYHIHFNGIQSYGYSNTR